MCCSRGLHTGFYEAGVAREDLGSYVDGWGVKNVLGFGIQPSKHHPHRPPSINISRCTEKPTYPPKASGASTCGVLEFRNESVGFRVDPFWALGFWFCAPQIRTNNAQ